MKTTEKLARLLSVLRKRAIAKILDGDIEVGFVDNYHMKIIIDGLEFDIWIANGESQVRHEENFRVQPFDLGEFTDEIRRELWSHYVHGW